MFSEIHGRHLDLNFALKTLEYPSTQLHDKTSPYLSFSYVRVLSLQRVDAKEIHPSHSLHDTHKVSNLNQTQR